MTNEFEKITEASYQLSLSKEDKRFQATLAALTGLLAQGYNNRFVDMVNEATFIADLVMKYVVDTEPKKEEE